MTTLPQEAGLGHDQSCAAVVVVVVVVVVDGGGGGDAGGRRILNHISPPATPDVPNAMSIIAACSGSLLLILLVLT